MTPQNLFRPILMQSLVAFACLASLSLFGVDTILRMATVSTLFVFCSLEDLRPKPAMEAAS